MSVQEAETEPIGWYLPHEVGLLAGVSGQQIGQWARHGYMQSAWARTSPRIYAYQDIAEAMVLHYLIDAEVPYRSIRKAVDHAANTYGRRWPLSTAQLFIVDEHPQGRGPRRTVVVDDYDVVAKHRVLGQLDLLEVRRDLEHGGWAARESPTLRHIEVNPARRSGAPVIRGTRILAEDVARMAIEPAGMAVLRSDFGLKSDQIDDAIEWYRIVTSYDSAHAHANN